MKTNIKGAFMSDCCNRIQPVLLSVLRIVTAYLFLLHGTSKIFAFPIEMGSGSPGGLLLLAGILEIVGGILLVLGLFARPAAFVLSGQMAVRTLPEMLCSRLPTAASPQCCSASYFSISRQRAAEHGRWTGCFSSVKPEPDCLKCILLNVFEEKK